MLNYKLINNLLSFGDFDLNKCPLCRGEVSRNSRPVNMNGFEYYYCITCSNYLHNGKFENWNHHYSNGFYFCNEKYFLSRDEYIIESKVKYVNNDFVLGLGRYSRDISSLNGKELNSLNVHIESRKYNIDDIKIIFQEMLDECLFI